MRPLQHDVRTRRILGGCIAAISWDLGQSHVISVCSGIGGHGPAELSHGNDADRSIPRQGFRVKSVLLQSFFRHFARSVKINDNEDYRSQVISFNHVQVRAGFRGTVS